MKTCVTSYSFSHAIGSGQLTLLDSIAKAKEIGFDTYEFASIPTPEGMDDLEYCAKLAARAKECDIPVVQLSVGANLLTGGDEAVAKLKHYVDCAEVLGAVGMRHDIAFGLWEKRPFIWQDAVKFMAPAIREVTEYAQAKGIKTMTENHGTIFQAPDRMVALVREVNHPNYGLLVDIGNFICCDVDPLLAVSETAPYAFHVHCKDFIMKPGTEPNPGGFGSTLCGNYFRGTVLGHGVIKVKQSLDLCKKYGFDGNVSLEFEGWEDNIKALEAGLAFMKRCMGL
ncbi:MAG: sugar phosphate isomerase/epimerase [Clostridiales bacterium]|nr:sugar phosphate isomerase/epimerase [Clostridiales bacterium]